MQFRHTLELGLGLGLVRVRVRVIVRVRFRLRVRVRHTRDVVQVTLRDFWATQRSQVFVQLLPTK